VSLLGVGAAALYFARDDAARRLIGWIGRIPFHPAQSWVDHALASLLSVSPHTLREIGAGTFFYAAVFLTEGVGLLLGRRWAEWVTVFATASFLPLEGYELTEGVSPGRLLLVAANLAIALYLIARLRGERRER
jgi:uncharacterized membrane protein (DUF2068 family)